MNEAPVDLVLSRLDRVKRCGAGWTARCPAHDDRHNSLKVDAGEDGQALVFCHAGCEVGAVVDALGLTLADLYPPKAEAIKRNGAGRRIVATYDYADEAGALLYQAVRYEPKGFAQRRPDGAGGWAWNLDGVRRVPYRLPDLLAADPAAPVLIVEGEKDVDRMWPLGFVATTAAGGAGKWRPEYGEPLRGRSVVVVPDNDEPGRQHAEAVARALAGIAAEVRLLALPGLPPKGDVSDWLDADGSPAELRRLIADAPAAAAATETTAADAVPVAPPLPAFPIEALPPAVRRYAVAAAASIPVPVEMVAVPLLGFAGALIGNRLHLRLKPSWIEYPTLYLAIVAPPGAAKSPALKLAQWPLDVLQQRAMTAYRGQHAEYEADLERWKAKKPKDRGEKPRPPALRHYFSTDLTVEALAGILQDAPGVAISRDEILSWVKSLDQYRGGGKGSDRQQYLALWSGATIKADRKNSSTVYRPSPVACVVGGIQPDFVLDLHDEANRRDGFVERVLPLVLLSLGAARWTEETIAPERYGDALAVFEALDALAVAALDADPPRPAGIGVELDPQARALWVRWHDENAALVERAGPLAAGCYRKLAAHVARFALILHALRNPDDPSIMVSGERMADAIALGEFFRAHLDRFLPLLGAAGAGRTVGLTARILRILRTSEERDAAGWVPRSALLNGLRNVDAAELTAALDALQEAGTVERRSVKVTTKPVEQWRLAHQPPRSSDYSDYLPDLGSGAEESTPEGGSDYLPGDSDYSDYLGGAASGAGDNPNSPKASPNGREGTISPDPSQNTGDSPNSPNFSGGDDPAGDADPALWAMAREILAATPAERAAFRRELDAEPIDDPEATRHRRALELADRAIADRLREGAR